MFPGGVYLKKMMDRGRGGGLGLGGHFEGLFIVKLPPVYLAIEQLD